MTPDPVVNDPFPSSSPKHVPATLRFAGVMAVFFLIGCAGLIPVTLQAIRDYRVAKVYLQSEAEIIEYIPINSGYDNRPGERVDRSTRPSFVFRFTTRDGKTITTRGYDAYGGREAPRDEWNLLSTGDRTPCWYDPADPNKAVLSKRFNPHFYWLLAWPVCFMGFSGLILRECFRRVTPPKLKGVEKGRRLAWRLPTVASQRAMTGCLGGFMVFSALLTCGFVLAALNYQVEAYRYRFISNLLGFNMNGWYWVAFASAVVTLVFLWAFLVNLRWFAVPDPVVEVNATRLRPGDSTPLYVRQDGPLKALEYTISLVCEINGIPGKPPARKETIAERKDFRAGNGREGEASEFSLELRMPRDARRTCKSVPMQKTGEKPGNGSSDLVSWFIRIERRVTPKTLLTSDHEILVGTEPA